MRLAVLAEIAMVDHGDRHAFFPRHGQTAGVRLVGQDQGDLERAVGVTRGVDQGGHVGAGAGDQDGGANAAGTRVRHQRAGGAGSPTETNDPGGPGKTTGLS